MNRQKYPGGIPPQVRTKHISQNEAEEERCKAKRMKKMRKGRDALEVKKAFIEAGLQVQKLMEQEFMLLPPKMAY